MKQSLQLRLGQQLTMTPQLQQAIRLLQLSSLDLQIEIQTILDSNLMLERTDESEEATKTSELNEPTKATESTDDKTAELDNSSEQELDTLNDTLPDELPVDSGWEDVYEPYDGATSYSRGDDEQHELFERPNGEDQSLQDYLLWQMRLTPFSDSDMLIATAIIDAVNDSGYLTLTAEELHQGLQKELDIELDEVAAVLHRVQHFDPPGVATSSASECLLLQLEQLPANTPWLKQARQLVQQHLELLAGHDFNTLMRRLKVSREALQQIIALIQSLDPYPGIRFSHNETQYVIPDVFVYRQKNNWRVDLNSDSAPRLRINAQYANLVRRADNSTDNTCLKNHLQEARWFLKSLRNRNETLLRVATCIVERQRGFLEFGAEHMQPLVLRDIAETMEMHESTISRVTTQKYMHTPKGIYEFKYFFSSHVGTRDGGECSSIAIQAMIKKLITTENSQKPLSDNKIAKLLGEEGIRVARRTVAKYREVLSIPASTDRKRLT